MNNQYCSALCDNDKCPVNYRHKPVGHKVEWYDMSGDCPSWFIVAQEVSDEQIEEIREWMKTLSTS